MLNFQATGLGIDVIPSAIYIHENQIAMFTFIINIFRPSIDTRKVRCPIVAQPRQGSTIHSFLSIGERISMPSSVTRKLSSHSTKPNSSSP